MLNTKEHFNQLDAIAVTELDNETAAAIQGGWALEVYRDINLKDRIGSFNVGTRQVKENDQISSVKINEGEWAFLQNADYLGKILILKPGIHNLTDFPLDSNTS
ncbi:beta/gamma crystallin-related protein [Nostoc sp. LPT]|uniref:beta/gamma crystallin-related protein n=1 Tax=Nostoc sp. LPT TaxID=2815387 RepID=UPI001D8CE2BC|nr:beta/gamma crystallin-related protein [Nostoc sp. LPT]MBN4000316.1 hypothetical protein [Nostoc sp. LPT]